MNARSQDEYWVMVANFWWMVKVDNYLEAGIKGRHNHAGIGRDVMGCERRTRLIGKRRTTNYFDHQPWTMVSEAL